MKAVYKLHNFLSDLAPAIIEDVDVHLGPPVTYSDGATICRYGETAEYLYQVHSGSVSLYTFGPAGEEISLTRFLPGDWVGHYGILDQEPRMNSAIASGATRVKALSRGDFLKLCERHPQLLMEFSIMQSLHVRLMTTLLIDAHVLSLSDRILKTIYRQTLIIGKRDKENTLYIDMSHEDLSNMVQASRQATSTALKKLEHESIIYMAYSRIYIPDESDLKRRCKLLSSVGGLMPKEPIK
jgi:CRP/FNR family cyclic AMP-dependent transcriptional regulator